MQESKRRQIALSVARDVDNADERGRVRYGENAERLITARQETAYRLCHHDFYGLDTAEAAEVMEIAPKTVTDLLQRIKATAPQLFPILTKDQAAIYHLFVQGGVPTAQIAAVRGISKDRVQHALSDLRKSKSLYFPESSGRRIKI